jgi:hypothetical protein
MEVIRPGAQAVRADVGKFAARAYAISGSLTLPSFSIERAADASTVGNPA